MVEARAGVDWRLLLVFFGLTAFALVIRSFYGSAPLINDTDDAMRLVEVRDLLAGQGWYHLIQHRLDAPYGASMHWSRLVDLPIAALILVLTPLAGQPLAETLVAYIYPLAMLLGLFWLSARVSMQLVGREGLLPGLALPAFSLVVFGDFSPGRFDHHSMQILLLLGTLSLALQSLRQPRFAAGAGITTAAALSVGVESLPMVVAAVAAYGLLWVLDGTRGRALRLFGLSLSISLLAGLALTTDPARWLTPYCDAISIVYIAAGCGTALAFALLSVARLENRSPWIRLGAGLAAGAVLIALLAALYPDCLKGPYAAVDPWLVANWLARIQEAKPAFAALLQQPAYVVAVCLPPLLALVVTIAKLINGPREERDSWVLYGVFLGLAILVTLLQVRGGRMAMPLSVPAGAALIVSARTAYLARASLLTIAGLLLAWLGYAGLVLALLTNLVFAGSRPAITRATAASFDELDCRLPAAYAALAGQPRQRILAPIDIGAHLLAYTPHDVVAAPYHRNQRGVRDSFDFFSLPIHEARSILERRGITEIVICEMLPELAVTSRTASDAFMPLLAAGHLPAWIVETSKPGDILRTFAVDLDGQSQLRPERPG